MSISILHISDIHPSPSDNLTQLAKDVALAIERAACPPNYIVASGDLGLKGKNQQESARFLTDLASLLGLNPTQIICVPGNHDIEKIEPTNPFRAYSSALYTITKDSARTTVPSVSLYRHDHVEFLLINSAYHLDPSYGRVDCNALRNIVSELSVDKIIIAVVHHNLIPVDENDRSTIVNAYEVLTLLSKAGCQVVLHGHQHASLSLTIAGTKLVGVGTIYFTPWKNVNNQFNVVEVGRHVVRFRYHADSSSSQGFGTWDAEKLSW